MLDPHLVHKIPQILQNMKAPYHVCNSLSRMSSLSHMNPVHALPSSVFKIHSNIICPSTSRYSKKSYFEIFPQKPCRHVSSPICTTCPKTQPFDQPNKICWGVPIMKLFVMQFCPVSCYFHLLRLKTVFFPYRETQSGMPTWNNRQHNCVYSNP